MIYTEAEAKTKRCYRRGTVDGTHSRCVASDCMAWRFLFPPVPNPKVERIGTCNIINPKAPHDR
jgi:hypothetical protein